MIQIHPDTDGVAMSDIYGTQTPHNPGIIVSIPLQGRVSP